MRDLTQKPATDSVLPASEVENDQTELLLDEDRFEGDPALQAAIKNNAPDHQAELESIGTRFASARAQQLAVDANSFPPQLSTLDRRGQPETKLAFHPAWHELMAMNIEAGAISRSWHAEGHGSYTARAAQMYLTAQTEAGHQCPISMSHGAIPVLRRHQDNVPEIGEIWLPRMLSQQYDPSDAPADAKQGLLLGMGMTEKQGGSDIRSNRTAAEPIGQGGAGQRYLLNGHKWFFSAPQCDGFLVTAVADHGAGCFLVPRLKSDGSPNGIHPRRLKDKLGNRSNASSEVDIVKAEGWLLGDEGRGVAEIIEMATHTRMDCVLATAGIQRRALCIAMNHSNDRKVFGKQLIKQPLMTNVLASLALESHATTALALWLATLFEPSASPEDRSLGRLLVAATKYHVCKGGAGFVAETMEVLGGNGYVEDWELARLYREMPLLSIWEGSGNIMCLDVIRSIAAEPTALAELSRQLDSGRGGIAAFDQAADLAVAGLETPDPSQARRMTHQLIVTLQALMLLRSDQSEIAEAWCQFRLGRASVGLPSYGTLPAGVDPEQILAAVVPAYH
ncbi:MAG: acyl-CoA dehydrogenase family protein [Pseudomonadota bacterium]